MEKNNQSSMAGEQQAPTEPTSSQPLPKWAEALGEEETHEIGEEEGSKEGGGEEDAQPAPPAPAQLSQEDIDKAFNVYRVAEQELANLGIEPTPEKIKHFNGILQGLARQAATVAHYQVQVALKQLQDSIGPMQEYVAQQRVEQMKTRFFEQFSHLKSYEPLLLLIRDSYIQQGRKFNSEKELFEAVSKDAETKLKEVGIDVEKIKQQSSAQKGGAKPGSTSSKMTTLSGGGQGGAGDNTKGSDKVPNWRRVLS
jgi:hypothetical protein